MKALQFLNQTPRIIRDNSNRDSSCCLSQSGAVIHSGVHRSTAFVSLPYALASLLWAKLLGQDALNGWIESTVNGETLATCELTALTRQFPDWRFYELTTKQGLLVTACQKSGELQTRISGGSWLELGRKLS